MMQVKHKETGSVYTLIATNPENERVVEQMVGKAMCALANAEEIKRDAKKNIAEYGHEEYRVAVQARMSEYEATARCISMLVEQPLVSVCHYIVVKCHEEFGI